MFSDSAGRLLLLSSWDSAIPNWLSFVKMPIIIYWGIFSDEENPQPVVGQIHSAFIAQYSNKIPWAPDSDLSFS